MIKHKYNKNFIYKGESFSPNKDGIIELPVRIDKLNPIKDDTAALEAEKAAALEAEKKIDWRVVGTEAGLKDDELEKFMKKSVANREKHIEALKVVK